MKACGMEGTNQGLVAFTSQSIHYICRFTFKEQMMEFVTALLEPFSFNNKFLHSSENRCVCIHRK